MTGEPSRVRQRGSIPLDPHAPEAFELFAAPDGRLCRCGLPQRTLRPLPQQGGAGVHHWRRDGANDLDRQEIETERGGARHSRVTPQSRAGTVWPK